MAHTVRLTRNHQRILLEALAISQEIKEKKLRNPDSRRRMDEEYYKAAKRLIDEADIECGRAGHKPGDNLFAWMRDQFYHSGDFTDTEFGLLAVNICEAAGDGVYAGYCRMTVMNRLFE